MHSLLRHRVVVLLIRMFQPIIRDPIAPNAHRLVIDLFAILTALVAPDPESHEKGYGESGYGEDYSHSWNLA
jgi:hypothetical protein